MRVPYSLLIASSALSMMVASSAYAAPVIVPASVVGSSSYPGYDASNAIDASDVSDWASLGQGVGSFLRIDLGHLYALTSFNATDRVTSGGGNNGFVGGLYDFTTSFTLQAFTDSSFGTSSSTVYTFNKTAPGSTSSPADFLFTGNTPALTGQYILYTVKGTAGVNPGLSNLEFFGTAVPEPATWGMMLLGFGATGAAMRYRRRSVKVSYS